MEPYKTSARALEARSFAVQAHGGQLYGEKPYVFHLDQVAQLATRFGEEAVVAAYLYDVVEDTDVTLADIESKFGRRIADCTDLLTDPPGSNRKERKAEAYARLSTCAFQLPLQVKLCDRLANVRASVADHQRRLWNMYANEHEDFRRSARRPGRSQVADDLWADLDLLLGDGAYDKLVLEEVVVPPGWPRPPQAG